MRNHRTPVAACWDIAEMRGNLLFDINTHNMLYFESFGLLFNAIAFICTLFYFLLSGSDIEK